MCLFSFVLRIIHRNLSTILDSAAYHSHAHIAIDVAVMLPLQSRPMPTDESSYIQGITSAAAIHPAKVSCHLPSVMRWLHLLSTRLWQLEAAFCATSTRSARISGCRSTRAVLALLADWLILLAENCCQSIFLLVSRSMVLRVQWSNSPSLWAWADW